MIPLILTDRLNQQAKWNTAFAQRIEEGTGFVADSREHNESVGIAYEGESSNEPY